MKSKSEVLFADIAVAAMETKHTLPAKFQRMLKKIFPDSFLSGKKVAVKMHFGGNIGYTTIHPVFVRILVQALKDSGAASIKAMDNNPADGVPRGYTEEVLGCQVVSCFGADGKHLRPEKIGFRSLDEALIGGELLDCDVFVDLAHVKGHGEAGFGGAIKNIGMGAVPGETRRKIHRLEGGLVIDRRKCVFCRKCYDACPNRAIILDEEKKQINIFYHHCTYCRHCVLACPKKAIALEDRRFEDFTRGLALVTAAFLKKFRPEDVYFINFLTDITVFCDCWGLSTASLVPDIGILASRDIAAIETASLDMIKTENLLANGLPKGRKLLKQGRHLFEKIHAKDPYLVISQLKELYSCSSDYEIKEIR